MASPEALCGRLQKDIDLKSSAQQYYKMWRTDSHQIPTATSQNIQAVALHEGDWHTHGAIKIWNYTVGTYAMAILIHVDEKIPQRMIDRKKTYLDVPPPYY